MTRRALNTHILFKFQIIIENLLEELTMMPCVNAIQLKTSVYELQYGWEHCPASRG